MGATGEKEKEPFEKMTVTELLSATVNKSSYASKQLFLAKKEGLGVDQKGGEKSQRQPLGLRKSTIYASQSGKTKQRKQITPPR